ncbi:aminopeptidase [Nevskia soli]|jgi:leucyl aminopeptidase (aminopeptidase T)|uniref:aminopeptidase n=1 Tax=Nevskia soli TaxID=418856 RepID=UPI0015D7A250|nr:aminopeptidase [Nevskia soli]
MKDHLLKLPFDPELSPGAYNAVHICLRVQPDEKVTVITDELSQEIACALAHELEALGAAYNSFTLEDLAPRPLEIMPQAILDDMETSQVSIFAVTAQLHELKTRMQMTDVVNRRHIRHAHMVNITKQIMLDGMRADYNEVDRISTIVCHDAGHARRVRATTRSGTDIIADMNPNYRWVKTSGIISPLKWGNLPGGETFTTPGEVNGTFVIDGVVGDYLCAKYGNLRDQPLTVHVKQNRLTEAHSENKELENEFWEYTHTDENSDRVGEFAIGTNVQLHDVIGNILQDEKIPGIHMAFGNPYGFHTGADWYSSTHIDVVGRQFSIWLDDRQIMNDGEFMLNGGR